LLGSFFGGRRRRLVAEVAGMRHQRGSGGEIPLSKDKSVNPIATQNNLQFPFSHVGPVKRNWGEGLWFGDGPLNVIKPPCRTLNLLLRAVQSTLQSGYCCKTEHKRPPDERECTWSHTPMTCASSRERDIYSSNSFAKNCWQQPGIIVRAWLRPRRVTKHIKRQLRLPFVTDYSYVLVYLKR
jgi:hypothetical protein